MTDNRDRRQTNSLPHFTLRKVRPPARNTFPTKPASWGEIIGNLLLIAFMVVTVGFMLLHLNPCVDTAIKRFLWPVN